MENAARLFPTCGPFYARPRLFVILITAVTALYTYKGKPQGRETSSDSLQGRRISPFNNRFLILSRGPRVIPLKSTKVPQHFRYFSTETVVEKNNEVCEKLGRTAFVLI